jgi:hypothetical protein
MDINDVVEFINSHDDPVLSEEMNALVMETCSRLFILTLDGIFILAGMSL